MKTKEKLRLLEGMLGVECKELWAGTGYVRGDIGELSSIRNIIKDSVEYTCAVQDEVKTVDDKLDLLIEWLGLQYVPRATTKVYHATFKRKPKKEKKK